MHKNIRTLHLILCMSIAIVGGNKTQMRESHAQCVRVGRSVFDTLFSLLTLAQMFTCISMNLNEIKNEKKRPNTESNSVPIGK